MNTRIVSAAKRQIRLGQRRLKDLWRATRFSRGGKATHGVPFPVAVSVAQPIRSSLHLDNKLHNLRNGIQKIETCTVLPGRTFSFWRIVGRPDAKNGYRPGRNIISGELREDYGGGLCQLSGIMYHAALLGGLQVTERHNHSVDIYREEERFTPLGADATVVYGYKDLRFKNNLAFPVRFCFELRADGIECRLTAPGKLTPYILAFERTEDAHRKTVVTRYMPEGRAVAVSVYKK